MFTLDLGIKDKGSIDKVFEICDEIEKSIGGHRFSSGYGFGIRDMQYEFNTKLEVEEAEKKVKEIFTKYRLEISKTDSYLGIYEESEDEE
jgi:acetone carboxylase gamma subunit